MKVKLALLLFLNRILLVLVLVVIVLVQVKEVVSFACTCTRTRTRTRTRRIRIRIRMTSSDTSSSDTTCTSSTAEWDPVAQIYVGGVMPGVSNSEIAELLQVEQEGVLRVFGYGSLCWNPGDGVLGDAATTATFGTLPHYRRVWAQKSTDHRGTPQFPGLVCTLLHCGSGSAVTQGTIYQVPPHRAHECLKELDFREKGGYAREIVVVQQEDGRQVSALLYRGTPDNPAFWPLVLQDLSLAAAVMAVATGPSGPNHVYLQQLDHFLKQHHTQKTKTLSVDVDDTCPLATMVSQLQNYALYFMYACGSNQHGQLRQHSSSSSKNHDNNHEDIPHLLESVLCCSQDDNSYLNGAGVVVVDPPMQLVAGGGHSGLITTTGQFFLWGWNEQGQCGIIVSSSKQQQNTTTCPLPVRYAISNVRVAKAAMGFSHTLVMEKETHKLYAWGDNRNGQCLHNTVNNNNNGQQHTIIMEPTLVFPEDTFVDIAAGVFHSAGITARGQLVTWGNAKHGQCVAHSHRHYWMPPDGARLQQVVCGRHHTAVVDDRGRIWTCGDNHYGQLGRTIIVTTEDETNSNNNNNNKKKKNCDSVPRLVDGPLGQDHDGTWRCLELQSGWSHLVARAQQVVSSDGHDAATTTNESIAVFGWGRSDKGQLGCHEKCVPTPGRIKIKDFSVTISRIACGSESTYLVTATDDDDKSTIWSCGWNEHGNLGVLTEDETDVTRFTPLLGTERMVCPPTYADGSGKLLMAAGGAHFLVMKM
jgi:alpha-tubulin suppressor-like RCC1 family protein/cation transport regulator ChaC